MSQHNSPTDPTGVAFLSYKRERHAEARLLIDALRDRGVPTWQDVSDLPPGVTEQEIRDTLGSPRTAHSVLWVTPEVEHSAFIRNIEVPLILERITRQDGFFVVPVAAGGLDYSGAAALLEGTLIDPSTLNMQKAPTDPIDADFAARIAQVVLEQRLKTISKAVATGDVEIDLSTRTGPSANSQAALQVDLRHRFEGRIAKPGAWDESILPALSDVVAVLQKHARERQIVVQGNAALPTAIAFGAACLAPGGLQIGWLQRSDGTSERWDSNGPTEDSGLVAQTIPQDPAATDLALLLSERSDVSPDFLRSSNPSNPYRAVVHVNRPGQDTRTRILTAPMARHAAEVVIDALRAARRLYNATGTVHLYLACPVGLAFLIGRQLNTFGTVQTYEHVPSMNPPYQPAAKFHPSCQ